MIYTRITIERWDAVMSDDPIGDEARRVLADRARDESRANSLRAQATGLWDNLKAQVASLVTGANKNADMQRVIGCQLQYLPQNYSGFEVHKATLPALYLRVRYHEQFFSVEWETVEGGIATSSVTQQTDNLRLELGPDDRAYLKNDRGQEFKIVRDAALYLLKPFWEASR